MSFGVLSFSEDAFSSEGSANVDITPSSLSATLSLGSVTVQGATSVQLPSLLLSADLGTITFSGDASFVLDDVTATLNIGTVALSGDANTSLSGLPITHNIGNIGIIGDANVSVAVFIGNNETQLTSNIGTVTTSGTASFELSSVNGTLALGTVTLSGDANFVIESNASFYGTDTYGNGIFVPNSVLSPLTTEVGTITVVGNADVTLPSITATLAFNEPSVVGNAEITLTSLGLLSTAIGTVTTTGNANLTLPSLEVITTLGTISVVGDANITISGYSMQLSFEDVIITAIRQDDYSKIRTVFVPYRQHNIRSKNNIANQNRTVIIPPRSRIVKTTKVAA